MEKCLAILIIFVTCVRSEYYEDPTPPSDNNIEELFLSKFLDEIKPFISPIVEEWRRHGSPENMPTGFFEHLVEKYARHSTSASPSLSPDAVESFLRNVEEFKTCVDQTLARAADDPALKDIQSIFPDSDEYSPKEKLSMFRALGDDKNIYSNKLAPSGTKEDYSTTSNPGWYKA